MSAMQGIDVDTELGALALRVLVVAAESETAEFATRVLEDHGDAVSRADDVPDALAQLTRSDHQMALVSLSLPRGDGLALVHHIRALHPHVDVVVMSASSDLEDAGHALALGVVQSLVLPLTGDALLVAADRCREKRALLLERQRLGEQGKLSQRRTATYARCAAFVSETDPGNVASRILDACVQEAEAKGGALYAPAYFGASSFARVTSLGEADALPDVLSPDALDALDPTRTVAEFQPEGMPAVWALPLLGTAELDAVIVMDADAMDEATQQALEIVAGLGTAALAAARRGDAIARAGIKDPDTSAYTFAYFGDVAGREIDRAARHGRRFALLTVNLDGVLDARESLDHDRLIGFRRLLSDALLDTVRDSDVLARVEDDEYYLLLPETGVLGALSAKRRIEARFHDLVEVGQFGAQNGVEPVVGVAVFPADGANLGKLLRVGRRRADRSREGVYRRLALARIPFWEALEMLLGSEDDAGVRPDGSVSLHEDLAQTHDALDLAHHAALPHALLPRIARSFVEDAIQHGALGTLYAAGDADMLDAIKDAVGSERSEMRAWLLTSDAGTELEAGRLGMGDPRLQERVIFLGITEVTGYMLIARRLDGETLLAYHTADLDLVDGLITALQLEYHLQPEVRT